MTTIIAIAPTNMKRLRSAIDADEPKVALSWVVSAVRRDTSSPVFSPSKKAEIEPRQVGEEVAAQIGDDPLAERHDEVVARPRGDRQHRDDADQGGEIEVDDARLAFGKAVVDHLPHGDRDDQGGGRGDDQGGQRADHLAAMGERVGQQGFQGVQRDAGRLGGRRVGGKGHRQRGSGSVVGIA